MASFYELTEEEVELLKRGLDCLISESMDVTLEKDKELEELKHYLETREKGDLP
ncbi:hypothetical protein ES708_27845 [subsurface metagenome]